MSVYKNGIAQDASAKVDLLQADVGDFTGRTYDPELLQVLGVPDTDGKDLYTCLITDRLDDGTFGLSQLATDIAAVAGTDNAALASVLGALDSAAAEGEVTDSDVGMAYLK